MSSEVATSKPTTVIEEPAKAPQRQVLQYLVGGQSQLPVLLTLVVIGVFFQITSHGLFLTPRNLSNLVLQIATIGSLGVASVLVLLIGEIDLSLGAVAYATANVTVVLSTLHSWSAPMALLAGLVVALAIGAVNGLFIAVLRVPSFIVTLAGLLFFQGFALHILLPQTDISISDPNIGNIATTYLQPYLGIGLPVLALVFFALGLFLTRLRRSRAQLPAPPMWDMWVRIGIATVLVVGTVSLFEANLGVPQSAMILMGIILLFWLVLTFTGFGRHIYAVGGNAEAARRAGINVTGVRLAIFVLASTLAFVGGILLASRQGVGSADVDPTLLLQAIAVAVIGGVSLFGGRGSVWGVVLGSLVIGSLTNGLDLLGQSSDIIFMIEGVVLIIAVTADALARRRSAIGVR